MSDLPQCAPHGEPIAWRWRHADSKHWIYDPTPEWREDFKDDPAVVFEPLFAAPSGADVREALEAVKTAILEADPNVLTCTLWMPQHISFNEIVVDYIDRALSADTRPPQADVRAALDEIDLLRCHLREARQYVSDAGLGAEDDNEIKIHSEALLALIDQALSADTRSPQADVRAAALALMQKWPGDYGQGDLETEREPNKLAYETARVCLAALTRPEPCEYCGNGVRTGIPGNACENCMGTGLKYPALARPDGGEGQ